MYGSSSAGVERGKEISKHAHTTVLCSEVMRSWRKCCCRCGTTQERPTTGLVQEVGQDAPHDSLGKEIHVWRISLKHTHTY